MRRWPGRPLRAIEPSSADISAMRRLRTRVWNSSQSGAGVTLRVNAVEMVCASEYDAILVLVHLVELFV